MKKNLFFPILYLVLVTICISSISVSKYNVSACGSDVARVARPVIVIAPQSATLNGTPVTVDITNGISLSNLQPGDVLVYDFNIKNTDGSGNVNEVLLRYNVNVSFVPSTQTLPLTYTLTSGGVAYGGTWVTMGYTANTYQQYELTVTWDSAQAGSDYTDQDQSVQITVNAEQMDS